MSDPSLLYFIEQTKEKAPTLALQQKDKKLYLHSRFYPTKERLPKNITIDTNKYDTLIVLGSALGYHLQTLKEKVSTYTKIFIIDILPNLPSEIRKRAISLEALLNLPD